MQIERRDGPTTAVFSVTGEIDAHTSADLLAVLVRAEVPADQLLVDTSAVTFIDSSGLSVFVDAKRQLEARGISLELVRPSQQVQRLFEISGLAAVFGLDT